MKEQAPIDSRTKQPNENCDLNKHSGMAMKFVHRPHDQWAIGNEPCIGTYVTRAEIEAHADAKQAAARVAELKAKGLLKGDKA